ENELIPFFMHVRDHRPRVELFRIELIGVVVGGPWAIDQKHRSRQSELAVPVGVFVDFPRVAMIVARLPGSECPIWWKFLAAGGAGESLQDGGKLRTLEQHYPQAPAEKLDQNARRVRDIQVESGLAGGVQPETVTSKTHEKGNRLVTEGAFVIRHVARRVLQ